MKPKPIKIAAVVATALIVTGCNSMSDTMSKATGGMSKKGMSKEEGAIKKAIKEDKMAFAGPASVDYADKLWTALSKANLVGPTMTKTEAYKGTHPHGAVLMNSTGTLTVGDNTGTVIVKSNFGGEAVSIDAVNGNPGKFLGAFTVMYKRPGYDPENQDWFWAKYLPDGTLDKNPKGMQLAGRVAKGMPAGCIACHKAAPGGDMLFTN